MTQTISNIAESDAPTSRRNTYLPLRMAVETAPGSGHYELDPRARIMKLSLQCDERLSEAEIDVNVGPTETEPKLWPSDVLSGIKRVGENGYISPDQRVIIFREGNGDDIERQIKFSGFVEIPRYAENQSERMGSMVVQSTLKRVAKSERGKVFGRYVRTSAAVDAYRLAVAADPYARLTPHGDADSVKRISRPCAFNARGEANRSPSPIEVTIDGKPRQIHVFSDDDDADAEPWTWAQALRYLVYFHFVQLDGNGDFTGLINGTNVFDQTDDYAAFYSWQRSLPPVNEVDGYEGHPWNDISDVLKFCLMESPSDAVVDGMEIDAALAAVAKETTSHFRVQTLGDMDQPQDCLIWWARGGGPRRTVSKDWDTSYRDLTVRELLEFLNISDFHASADYSDIITKVIAYGDIRRYEITASLVPGWKPDASVDNLVGSAAIDAAVAASEAHLKSSTPESDAWFQKYCVNGSSFQSNAAVGRRWVLNETGRYDAASYARSSGYFLAAKYAPWEPTACNITDRTYNEAGEITVAAVASGSWSRIPRPFGPCFSADHNNRSLNIVVEASFNSGGKWERIECNVLNTEAGIYVCADDLAKLTSAYDAKLHFWKAMCQGAARLRVTAVIEGDDRLVPRLDATKFYPPIQHEAARLFDWSQRFVSNRRDGGNSIFAPGGERAAPSSTFECRDDLEAIQEAAKSVLDLCSQRQIVASFTIPWLEFTRYWVGDNITGVDGLGLLLEGAAAGGARRPPDIVALVYSGTTTQIVLEDANLAEVMEP